MEQTENLTDSNVEENEKKSKQRSRTFAGTMQRGVDMASGINEHLEALSPRGLNEETIQRIDTLVGECRDINKDQEILKGKLKEKTSELERKVDELLGLLSQCNSTVKTYIAKDRWVDFGIRAKR